MLGFLISASFNIFHGKIICGLSCMILLKSSAKLAMLIGPFGDISFTEDPYVNPISNCLAVHSVDLFQLIVFFFFFPSFDVE